MNPKEIVRLVPCRATARDQATGRVRLRPESGASALELERAAGERIVLTTVEAAALPVAGSWKCLCLAAVREHDVPPIALVEAVVRAYLAGCPSCQCGNKRRPGNGLCIFCAIDRARELAKEKEPEPPAAKPRDRDARENTWETKHG